MVDNSQFAQWYQASLNAQTVSWWNGIRNQARETSQPADSHDEPHYGNSDWGAAKEFVASEVKQHDS